MQFPCPLSFGVGCGLNASALIMLYGFGMCSHSVPRVLKGAMPLFYKRGCLLHEPHQLRENFTVPIQIPCPLNFGVGWRLNVSSLRTFRYATDTTDYWTAIAYNEVLTHGCAGSLYIYDQALSSLHVLLLTTLFMAYGLSLDPMSLCVAC